MPRTNADGTGHAQPLRLAFDARMALHSGIGTYIRGLVEGFVSIRSHHHAVPRFQFFGPPDLAATHPVFGKVGEWSAWTAGIYSVAEQLLPPRAPGVAAWHFPHYNVPVTLPGPFFVTIHDLIHLLHPEWSGGWFRRAVAERVLRRAAKEAQAVFTVSDASKRDIVEHLGLAEERVVVTPNAVSPAFQPKARTQVVDAVRRLGLPDRYILAVAIHKPHKNLEFLIRVFSRWAKRSGADLRLVICGVGEREGDRLARFAAEMETSDWMMPVACVPHGQMPQVYQGATALVFPSLVEGFGLPILEAQRMGVPVLCSSSSCMPEVAGAGALFFDPRSEAELAARLDELCASPTVRENLIREGHRNEKRFCWEETARKTVETYRATLGV